MINPKPRNGSDARSRQRIARGAKRGNFARRPVWPGYGKGKGTEKKLSLPSAQSSDGLLKAANTPDLVEAAALYESLADERMRAEFAAGLKYVRECIPAPMNGPVSVDWRYVPASTLGGDTIGYHWLDGESLALYLIDVTGHGLDSALLSVTLTNIIRTGALSGVDMKLPRSRAKTAQRSVPRTATRQ